MNGLLKSKTFKKNIGRWLVMYFGVIGMFATVVTYSKYISKIDMIDTAKVAKFVVKINYLEKCVGQTTICSYSSESVRPTSKYEYAFQVDTSELEVSTLLVVSANIHLGLTDIVLYEYNEITDKWDTIDNSEYTLSTVEDQNTHEKLYKMLSISDTIDITEENRKSVKKYKISAAWDDEVEIPEAQFQALKVGYSAIQQN